MPFDHQNIAVSTCTILTLDVSQVGIWHSWLVLHGWATCYIKFCQMPLWTAVCLPATDVKCKVQSPGIAATGNGIHSFNPIANLTNCNLSLTQAW